jgi:hypothetical protein
LKKLTGIESLLDFVSFRSLRFEMDLHIKSNATTPMAQVIKKACVTAASCSD